MKPPYRAVFLDFDGTLVDSEALHHEAWLQAVRPFGASTSWDDYQARFVGKTDTWAGKTFLGEAGHEPTPERLREVATAKHAYFREHAETALAVAGELRSYLLEELDHVALAVVSSSPAIDVAPVLERAGLLERFEFLVLGDTVSKHKPDPEPYNQALEQMAARLDDLNAPECLVFEDSSSGIASAKAAGLDVVAVPEPAALLTLMRKNL